jgi:hypothetical protein
MRHNLVTLSCFVLVLSVTVVGSADAKPFKLKGTFSRDTVMSACANAGAAGDNVVSHSATTGPDQSYGCDNFSTGTGVNCSSKGVCTGYGPGKMVLPSGPKTLNRLLQATESAGQTAQ